MALASTPVALSSYPRIGRGSSSMKFLDSIGMEFGEEEEKNDHSSTSRLAREIFVLPPQSPYQ